MYRDDFQIQSEYINSKIDDKLDTLLFSSFIGEVTTVSDNGTLVDVKPLNSESATKYPIKPVNNCIVTNNTYIHTPINVGDIGVCININKVLTPIMKGLMGVNLVKANYFIFIPVVTMTKSNSIGVDEKTLQITSSDGNSTKIVIKDDGITIKTNKLELTDDGDFKVSSKGNVEIKGDSAPATFGNSNGTIKDCFDQLIQTLETTFTGATPQPGAPLSPSFAPSVAQVKAKIGQILG